MWYIPIFYNLYVNRNQHRHNRPLVVSGPHFTKQKRSQDRLPYNWAKRDYFLEHFEKLVESSPIHAPATCPADYVPPRHIYFLPTWPLITGCFLLSPFLYFLPFRSWHELFFFLFSLFSFLSFLIFSSIFILSMIYILKWMINIVHSYRACRLIFAWMVYFQLMLFVSPSRKN